MWHGYINYTHSRIGSLISHWKLVCIRKPPDLIYLLTPPPQRQCKRCRFHCWYKLLLWVVCINTHPGQKWNVAEPQLTESFSQWRICGSRRRSTPPAGALWYPDSQGKGPWSGESSGPLSVSADQWLQHHKVSWRFSIRSFSGRRPYGGQTSCWISLPSRGLKDLEQDSSSMEKRFAYRFLKKLLKYVDSAQEFIAHLGTLSYRRRGETLRAVSD